MKRMNNSMCISCSFASEAKKPSLDGSLNNFALKSSTDECDIELPDAYKLAKAKFFWLTRSVNGKVLGCGEVVDIMPQNSKFVIRIYNRDYENNGKLNNVVELTMEDLNEIHGYKSEIENKIKDVRTKKLIFEFQGMKVFVGPAYNKENQKTVEIVNAVNIKSSMFIETFDRMMSLLPKVAEQHAKFNQRRDEEMRIVQEILNVLAYNRNEKRSNNMIREPNVRGRSAIYTTADKIVNQARMILPKTE